MARPPARPQEEAKEKGIPPPRRRTEITALIVAAVVAALFLIFLVYDGGFTTAPVDNEGTRAVEPDAPSETAEPRANVTEGDAPQQ